MQVIEAKLANNWQIVTVFKIDKVMYTCSIKEPSTASVYLNSGKALQPINVLPIFASRLSVGSTSPVPPQSIFWKIVPKGTKLPKLEKREGRFEPVKAKKAS